MVNWFQVWLLKLKSQGVYVNNVSGLIQSKSGKKFKTFGETQPEVTLRWPITSAGGQTGMAGRRPHEVEPCLSCSVLAL